MIFRGRTRHVTVWRRFRAGHDGFTFEESLEGFFEAHVAANAERAVDLLHLLSEHLSPAVDVSLTDRRNQTTWDGTDVALPDVRDAIARLKIPLATYAGVDITVFTPEDQLSLTAELDLYAFGRSDRWLYLLQARGLEPYGITADRAWRAQPWDRGPAAVLTNALVAVAERLSLTVVA